MAEATQPITIVGAGVIGLSAATLLQERHPTSPITIVAAEVPTLPTEWTLSDRPSVDYASMWAGAHFRPVIGSTDQLLDEAKLASSTSVMMHELAEKHPDSGIADMPAMEFFEEPSDAVRALKTGDPYAGPNGAFRVLDANELPSDIAWACEYQSFCANIHVYCAWLLQRFLDSGGKVIRRRLESINDAFVITAAPVVINCSGRNFDQDPKVKYMRGQTVLVRNPYHSTVNRINKDGSFVALIPRPGGGGTIIGASREPGDPETAPRPETRRKLLNLAVRAFPDFVDDVSKFDIVMDNVGRRPWREGGLRIEVERVSDSRTVVHGYGAGSRGYELSWGIAERVADLYDELS